MILNLGKPLGYNFIYKNELDDIKYDSIISFGYRKKIPADIVKSTRCINLHISYLPYNKGADPNFWSFWDETPKGVSIHLMNDEIDGGNILVQEEVSVGGTLRESYAQLESAITTLFHKHKAEILDKGNQGVPQIKGGSFHYKADKTGIPITWDTHTDDIPKIRALYYIDKIQEVRAKNNANWMDILRLAVKENPAESIPLIRKIAGCDKQINEFLARI